LLPTKRRNVFSWPLPLLKTLPSVPLPLVRSAGKRYFSPTRRVLLRPSLMELKFVVLRKLVQSVPSGGAGSASRLTLGGLLCHPAASAWAPLEPSVPPLLA
jgi:hypothetical protein